MDRMNLSAGAAAATATALDADASTPGLEYSLHHSAGCPPAINTPELAYYPSSAFSLDQDASSAMAIYAFHQQQQQQNDDDSSLSAIARYHAELSECLRRTSTSSGSTMVSSVSSGSIDPQHQLLDQAWSAASSQSPYYPMQDDSGGQPCSQQQTQQQQQSQPIPGYATPTYFTQTPSPPAFASGLDAGFDFYSATYTHPPTASQQQYATASHFHTPAIARYSCTLADCTWATDDRQLLKHHLEQHARTQVHHCTYPGCYTHYVMRENLHLHVQQQHIPPQQPGASFYGGGEVEVGISPFSTAAQASVHSYFEPQHQATPQLVSQQSQHQGHNQQLVGLGLVQAASSLGQYAATQVQSQLMQHTLSDQHAPYAYPQLQQLRIAEPPCNSPYSSPFPVLPSQQQQQAGLHRRNSDTDVLYGHIPSSLGSLASAPTLSALHEHAEEEEVAPHQQSYDGSSTLQPSTSNISLASFSSDNDPHLQLLALHDQEQATNFGLGLTVEHSVQPQASEPEPEYYVYAPAPGMAPSFSTSSGFAHAEEVARYSSPAQMPASAPPALSSVAADPPMSAHITFSDKMWSSTAPAAVQPNELDTPSLSPDYSQGSQHSSTLGDPLELHPHQMKPFASQADAMLGGAAADMPEDAFRPGHNDARMAILEAQAPVMTVSPLEYIGLQNAASAPALASSSASAFPLPSSSAGAVTGSVERVPARRGSASMVFSSPILAQRAMTPGSVPTRMMQIPRRGSDASYLATHARILSDTFPMQAPTTYNAQKMPGSPIALMALSPAQRAVLSSSQRQQVSMRRGSSASPVHLKRRMTVSPEMLVGGSATLEHTTAVVQPAALALQTYPHMSSMVKEEEEDDRMAAAAALYGVAFRCESLDIGHLDDESAALPDEDNEDADATFQPFPLTKAAVKRKSVSLAGKPPTASSTSTGTGKPRAMPGPKPHSTTLSIKFNLVEGASSTFSSAEGGEEAPVPVAPLMVNGRRKKDGIPLTDEERAKLYACSHSGCDRAFKRLEHRRRHERSHTLEKPYQCDIDNCGRYFSRSDNLTQHKRTHYKPGGRNNKAHQEEKRNRRAAEKQNRAVYVSGALGTIYHVSSASAAMDKDDNDNDDDLDDL